MSNAQAQSSPISRLAGAVLLPRLARNWWLLLLRGIVAIAFGVCALAWPGPTLFWLVILWGAYAIVDGVVALSAALFGEPDGMAPRWWLAVVGIVGVLAGLLTFAWPGITALTLLLFIASWAIVVGVLQIWGAIRLRREIDGEWLMILGGVVLVAYGIVLLTRPGVGALASIWAIGSFSIVVGCTYVALSFWLRSYRNPAISDHRTSL